jgi:hypothetical protein
MKKVMMRNNISYKKNKKTWRLSSHHQQQVVCSVLSGKSRGRLTAFANNIVSKRVDNIVLIGNNRAKVPVLAKHRLLITLMIVTKLFFITKFIYSTYIQSRIYVEIIHRCPYSTSWQVGTLESLGYVGNHNKHRWSLQHKRAGNLSIIIINIC